MRFFLDERSLFGRLLEVVVVVVFGALVVLVVVAVGLWVGCTVDDIGAKVVAGSSSPALTIVGRSSEAAMGLWSRPERCWSWAGVVRSSFEYLMGQVGNPSVVEAGTGVELAVDLSRDLALSWSELEAASWKEGQTKGNMAAAMAWTRLSSSSWLGGCWTSSGGWKWGGSG